MNKKILISLSVIGAVAAIAVGGTIAYFSDTETSTGNTFTAGAIDLGIDNTGYLNGVANATTTWEIAYDLDDQHGPSNGAYLFFNFADLKPGDWGEDTVSINVNNNDAWVCSETTVTDDRDNGCTEPENDVDAEDGACDVNNGQWSGDLADEIQIMWWADDGDNVFETNENVLYPGVPINLGQAPQGTPVTVTLADSLNNIWTGHGPLPGATTKYIAKAWCFGDLSEVALGEYGYSGPDQDNNEDGEITSEDGGFSCTGASVIDNASQSDNVKLDVSFRAEQAKNNAGFNCLTAR